MLSLLPYWLLIVALALVVAVVVGRHVGAWASLVRAYPAAERSAASHREWASLLILGMGGLRNSTWLELDDVFLHVYPAAPLKLVRRGFSVPMSEITVTADTWGVVAQKVVRLTFARAPEIRFAVAPPLFERLAKASGGRLSLRAP